MQQHSLEGTRGSALVLSLALWLTAGCTAGVMLASDRLIGDSPPPNRAILEKDLHRHQAAVEANPLDARAWLELGEAQLDLGHLEKARDALEMAADLDPHLDSPRWSDLGYLQIRFNRPEKAVQAFQRALERNPDDHNARFGLGNAYSVLGQHHRARETFAALAGESPEDVAVLNALGAVYNDLQDYQSAVEILTRAQRLAPKKKTPKNREAQSAWNGLATAYSGLQEYGKALEALKKSQAINPRNPDTWYRLGVLYGQLGEPDKAMKMYRKLHKQGDERAGELLNRIQAH